MSCDRPSNLTQIGFKSLIFGPYNLEIRWITSKNNKASMLHQALCMISKPSVNSTWSYIPETLNWGKKIGDFFLSRITLEFDEWPWKITGHLFYVTSSFLHYFTAIDGFQLELQSRNSQFWSKSVIFFVLCYLEIWIMTLKNKRAPLLCYSKTPL